MACARNLNTFPRAIHIRALARAEGNNSARVRVVITVLKNMADCHEGRILKAFEKWKTKTKTIAARL